MTFEQSDVSLINLQLLSPVKFLRGFCRGTDEFYLTI